LVDALISEGRLYAEARALPAETEEAGAPGVLKSVRGRAAIAGSGSEGDVVTAGMAPPAEDGDRFSIFAVIE
jgi:hypothetical protein